MLLLAGQHQQALEANNQAFALQPVTSSTLDAYYGNLYVICDQHQEESLLPIFKAGLETYSGHQEVVFHWLAILYDNLDNH